ncbi:MAG: radical SAM protein [Sutterellaceae bacterium]|nr:radical SAM protein [Sutterellaceae bacterium]MDD7441515.1 radical SAM protein [Sutterellaceae bacterium]MDY2867347.1 radical SAM protein [Mesosutterella sp.]
MDAIPALPQIQDLTRRLECCRAKAPHLRRVYRAWLGRAAWPDEGTLSLPETVRRELPALHGFLRSLAVPVLRTSARDGSSVKLLMRLRDGQTVETVVLPKDAVCVSTQAGCAVGCRFCMTGRFGLMRQLGSAEIAAQVAAAREVNPGIRKVDFMGMGEPSHNLRAVLEAVQFLGTYGDFGHKSLMLSSIGDRRLFDALLALPEGAVRPALALSLHSATDEGRRALIAHPGNLQVAEMVSLAERYSRAVRYPIQYEWVLIRGINDGEEEIGRLIELLRGRFAMVNFIPVNEVEGSPFRRPAKPECLAILERVRAAGIVAKIRLSAAQDVEGGCGQLRARADALPASPSA